MPFSIDLTSFSFADILAKSVPYLFGLLVLAFIVTGGILDYHWRTYGVGLIKLLHFRISYLVLGFILIGVMYVAMNSFAQ